MRLHEDGLVWDATVNYGMKRHSTKDGPRDHHSRPRSQ